MQRQSSLITQWRHVQRLKYIGLKAWLVHIYSCPHKWLTFLNRVWIVNCFEKLQNALIFDIMVVNVLTEYSSAYVIIVTITIMLIIKCRCIKPEWIFLYMIDAIFICVITYKFRDHCFGDREVHVIFGKRDVSNLVKGRLRMYWVNTRWAVHWWKWLPICVGEVPLDLMAPVPAGVDSALWDSSGESILKD